MNSVHPGYIWNALVEQLGKKPPKGVQAFREQLESLHPVWDDALASLRKNLDSYQEQVVVVTYLPLSS